MDDARYDFGNNWFAFNKKIITQQFEHATSQMARLVGDIEGKSLVDVGSGSGLHSLAALNLGASNVIALDYDPISVKATTELLSRYADGKHWIAVEADILSNSLDGILFDVVYSWGVLHHTGSMWQALENASKLCRPKGIFAVALYIKTPWCEFWKNEKLFYTRHVILRPLLDVIFTALIFARKLLSGKNPFVYVSEYSTSRGMNFFTDIRDWLGGYPYESADDEDIHAFMTARGFSLLRKFNTTPGRGILGTGCGEWVYQKTDLPPV